ncbi:uncharacterized protein [Physcomitrium patens]|uniref:Uncharacterized protein n=2 Tax=Physcomitrium patens TaxID=3218 RepID=A0A2K1IU85_PHYPA|nr:uncharacterized protein LOC112273049 [Physcomitrium patens]PNR32835.1 hypothetical protein PHYPA_024777 [Physcomitrium patens]|eukprot:XP_024357151.1 uncharacterized protein LOC112273049 [Physcomitrella patens]
MGRPKKAAVVRRALLNKDTNLPAPTEVKPVENVDEEVSDFEEQLRIVNLVCNAVDQEVESRSAAIVAIGDGHMASATTQLQLMMSKFPEHIRKMPLKKFLKQHCPNTIANTRSDGTVYFDPVLESEPFLIGRFQAPGGGVLNFNSLNFNSLNFNTGFASVQNTPGFGPSKTLREQVGEGVSNEIAGQKDIEQLSWDEFLASYRMQSAMKGPSAWDTPSLRTPGMNWRDTMITRNYTPMTEKVFPSMLPSQTGKMSVGGTKRKAPTSRGLRM